jgi:predicted NBD/HSP70 family sugar kinase
MKNIPLDSRIAGQRNERLVLSMLREHAELSQSQVCRMIGLGSSTASSIVSRLRDKGLVIETQGESDKRGPKPVLLKINSSSRYVVGIEINPSFIHFGLFDFTANLLDKSKVLLNANYTVEHSISVIAKELRKMISRIDNPGEKLLGIGVTLSGSISPQGTVQLSSTLGWKQVPLKELLELRLKQKVAVYGSRVRLMAEIAMDPELQSRNVVYVNVANGVGATVYADSKLMIGATGRCGEIGHSIADPNGPVCGCGHKGCLETLISGRAIAERIRKDIAAGTKTRLTEWLNKTETNIPEEVVALWGKAISEQDSYALDLRAYVANWLSRAVSQAINSFDPDTIILAGYVCRQSPEYFAESIRHAMNEQVYDLPLRDIRIMDARVGEEALIKGVAMAILQDIHPV